MVPAEITRRVFLGAATASALAVAAPYVDAQSATAAVDDAGAPVREAAAVDPSYADIVGVL